MKNNKGYKKINFGSMRYLSAMAGYQKIKELTGDEDIRIAFKDVLADIVQQCYLECIAVECGEGECAKAIATKFPKLVSRLKDEY